MKNSLFTRLITVVMLVMIFLAAKTRAQNILADVIPATYNVSPTGAFTYSVPLNLPPGIGELMPGLAISYNSQGGNGLLGVGWSMSGLSSITRGTKTLFHNGKVEPVDFVDDAFYLDGQRLFDVGGNMYNSEVKNFAIIRAVPFTPAQNGPSHFLVEYPNGLIYHYGNSQSSKFIAQGKFDVLMWGLNKIEDQYGNYIEFNYNNNPLTGDYRIANIKYTGNSNTGIPTSTEIIFQYVARTDKNKIWISGSQIRTDVVLDYIQVEHNASFVKKYDFDYNLNMYTHLVSIKEILPNGKEMPAIDITWASTSNGPTNVATSLGSNSVPYDYTVGDFNGDGATDIAKYKVWSSPFTQGSVHISDKNDNFTTYPSDDIQHPNAYTIKYAKKSYNGIGSFYFDYDGDGDDDMLATSPDVPIPSNVRLDAMLFKFDENQGKMVYDNLIMRYAPLGGTSTAWTDRALLVPGDFDGDGKTEVLFGYPNIQTQSGMVLSYDLFLLGEEYPCVPDAFGNIKPHIIFANVGSVSNGHYSAFAMDMDGDGKDEFVRAPSNSMTTLEVYKIDITYNPSPSSGPKFYTTNPGNSLISVYTNSFPNNYHYMYPGDFNGDGNSDLLVFALPNNNPGPQNGNWRIEYSKGNSFDVQSLPSNVSLQVQGPTYPAQQTYHISDFNGDGKTDILQLYKIGSSTPGYDLYYSVGDNVFEDESGQLPNIHHENVIPGDFNGDGQMDLLCHYGSINTTPYLFYFNKNANNHTVTSIAHADHTIDVETEYLTHDAEYIQTSTTVGGTLGYPFIERQLPMRVVKRVSDNVGNEQTFKYSNYIFNQLGLGMRGMMYTWVTDVPKSKMIANEYTLLGTIRAPYLSKSALWDLNTFNDVQNSTLPPFPATKPITLTETLMEDVDGGLSGKIIIPFSQDVHTYDFSKGTYTHKTLNGQNLNTGPGTSIYEFGLVPYIVTYSYYNQVVNSASTEHFTYNMTAPFNMRAKPTRRQTVTGYNATSYTRTTDFTYNSQGSTARSVADPGTPNQLITDYTYNAHGNLSTVTETPFGGAPTLVATYTYSADERFRETTTNALNYVAQTQYDNVWGNVMQSTDIHGLTTTYQYDENNRVTVVNTPTGMQTLYFYDWAVNSFFNPTYTLDHERPRFLVTEQIVGMGGSTLRFNDFYGRKIRGISVAFDGSVLYQDDKYNEKGLLIESKEPFGTLNPSPVVTTYTYDDMDRLTSTSMSNNGPSSTISYSLLVPDMPPHGMETTVTTSGGIVKTTRTNAMGQALRVTEGGNTIDYGYHANGGYLDITVNGNTQLVTQYAYDAYGRTTSVTEPNTGPMSYTYDPYDRVLTKTDANGTTFTYTYDVLDRLVSKIDNIDNILYSYNYDNTPNTNTTGKLITTTSTAQPQAYDMYAYDQYGRMIDHNGALYEYDLYNRMIKYEFRGDAYNKIYNAFGYLAEVTSDQEVCSVPSGPCFNYIQTLWRANAVNHRGQVTEADYFNYQNTPIYREDKAYDAFGYITDHTVTNLVSTNVVYDHQYSFDADNGNLDSRMDVLRSLTENFTYDSKERLTDVAYSNSLPNLQMTYDNNGNILKKSDVSASIYDWKYNAYALTRVPEPQTSTPAHEIPVNKQMVAYTPFRKAKTINEEVNRIDIKYNPFTEQRTQTEWYDINGNPAGTLLKTRMYHDRAEIFISAINNPNQCAVWSNYVDAYGSNIAIIERKTYSQNPFPALDDTAIYFTITDHLGSLVMILDNVGLVNDGVLEERSYDAWGRTRDINTWQPDQVMQSGIQFNPGWIVDRGYTFHEHYWENGIINMNGRLYDPLVGRMFSPDPANVDNTNTESYNKYAYVMNNPLKYTDPSGNEPVTMAVVIGAAIVGAATNVAFNYNKIGSFADGLGYAMIGAYAGIAGSYIGAGVAAAIGVGSAMGVGAATGAAAGAASGFITGAGNAYIGYASAAQGLKAGLLSAGIGAASGAVSGAVVGGLRSVIGRTNEIGGGDGGKAEFLDEEIPAGAKPTETGEVATIKSNPSYGKYGWTRNGGAKAHRGVDYAGEIGDEVYAMYDGEVTYIPRFEKEFGPYHVETLSKIGDKTYNVDYGHMSKALVKVGDKVKAGQVIGLMGREGNLKNTTFPTHVHIAVWRWTGKMGFVQPSWKP